MEVSPLIRGQYGRFSLSLSSKRHWLNVFILMYFSIYFYFGRCSKYYDAGEVSSLCRTVPKIKRFKTRLYSLYASSPFLKGLRFILRMLAAMLHMISGYVFPWVLLGTPIALTLSRTPMHVIECNKLIKRANQISSSFRRIHTSWVLITRAGRHRVIKCSWYGFFFRLPILHFRR